MTNQLFEAALGIKAPWYVQSVDFDAGKRQLTIAVDFVAGSRFGYASVAGEHPVHERSPRLLPPPELLPARVRARGAHSPSEAARRLGARRWSLLPAVSSPASRCCSRPSCCCCAREMPFTGVSRITGLSVHRAHGPRRAVRECGGGSRGLSARCRRLAIDETSPGAKGHDYVTLFADW